MARRTIEIALAALILAGGAALAADDAATFDAAARVFDAHCITCHSGEHPKMGLDLSRGAVYRSAVNVASQSTPRLKRVDPGRPDESLLLRKLLAPGEGGYRGPRMPMGGAPLAADEIAAVRAWIASFPQATWTEARVEEKPPPPRAAAFHDSFLAHLPTTDTVGAGVLEVRVAHRFKESIKDGDARHLWGLDSGAWISLGLAYGVADRVDLGLRRSNFSQAYEAYGKVALLRQGRVPLALTAFVSASHLDDTSVAHRDGWSAQLAVSSRVADWLSLLAVPSYAARTNYLDPHDASGTTALGLGAEVRLNSFIALTGEWIGQSGGVRNGWQAGSLGLSVRTANHAFQIVLTNVPQEHTGLYLPGGDLSWRKGQFRLGFNISRTFPLRH